MPTDTHSRLLFACVFLPLMIAAIAVTLLAWTQAETHQTRGPYVPTQEEVAAEQIVK